MFINNERHTQAFLFFSLSTLISSVIIIFHLGLFFSDMLAHSPKDRSRSPHRTTNGQTKNTSSSSPSSTVNDTPSQDDANSKSKKENDSQLQMKNLKVKPFELFSCERDFFRQKYIDFYSNVNS